MTLYRAIIADPPWRYSNSGDKWHSTAPYQSMKVDQICALEIPAADDCVLFLWATWPCLEDAMRVIHAWGFTYKTGLPWIKADGVEQTLWGGLDFKPFYGCGFWIRGCSEPILIAKRGNAKPLTSDFVGLISPNAEHSRKPDDLYTLAERYPGPRLEMFARRKRPGWDVWGNEVDSDWRPNDDQV